jgi:Nucleoside phosphorylase
VATVGEKQALHLQTHAHAVDMESHIVARVSARRGLPFAVLRVISDAATDRLPPAALCGMRSDGSMAIGAVLGSLARNPIQLPALVRTAWHAQRGFRALLRCYRSVRLVDLIEHALDMP